MKVRWNKQSKERLLQPALYIHKEYGQKARDAFMQAVQQANNLLADNPHLGAVETLLSDLPSQYRSVVIQRINKIVYRLVENHIEVIAFWDVRREPKQLAENITQTIDRQ